jgi:hypothetical protein
MRSPDLTVWAFCVVLRRAPDDGEGAADVARFGMTSPPFISCGFLWAIFAFFD